MQNQKLREITARIEALYGLKIRSDDPIVLGVAVATEIFSDEMVKRVDDAFEQNIKRLDGATMDALVREAPKVRRDMYNIAYASYKEAFLEEKASLERKLYIKAAIFGIVGLGVGYWLGKYFLL